MRQMEGKELRETVERLEREEEEVQGSLEEAMKERNRLAKELVEVRAEKKTLIKWGLKALKGRNRLAKELLEVRAGSETLINDLKNALRQKESDWKTVNGNVIKLLEQLKAQEEVADEAETVHRELEQCRQAEEDRRAWGETKSAEYSELLESCNQCVEAVGSLQKEHAVLQQQKEEKEALETRLKVGQQEGRGVEEIMNLNRGRDLESQSPRNSIGEQQGEGGP